MSRFPKAPAAALTALLLGACLAACGQPAQAPAAPAPTEGGGRLFIAWVNPPGNFDDVKWKGRTPESLAYLSRLLRSRGWDIEVSLAGTEPRADDSLPDAVDVMKAAVAAGSAADGYIVTDAEATALLKAGLAQDPRGVLPTAAPALYDRYRKIIDRGAAGVPLSTNLFDGGTPTVLYLEKGAAKAGMDIKAMSDILTFLEKNPKVRIGVASLYRSASVPEVWAAEQGYYAPDARALRGQIYARFGDPRCVLVPIEDIPGFDAFYKRWFVLNRAGRFVDTNLTGMLDVPVVVGFVGPLLGDMDNDFLQSHGKTGADYLAFPLAGCATAAEALDPPRAYRELALTAPGEKAVELAGFIEWALVDQKNYRLLRYGAEGVDWRLTDGRVEYLNYRQPLGPADWSGDTKAYYMNNFCPFYDDSFEAATVYMPGNYAEARAACRPVSRPLSAVAGAEALYRNAALSQVRGQFWQVTTQREQLLAGTVLRDRGGIGDYAAECLVQLRGIRADTDKMIAAYQGCIDELLAGAAPEGAAGGK